MSMKSEFFCCIGAELKDEIAGSLKSSRIFMYRAAESQTIADMLVNGFFNEADDLRVNDIILLYCPEQARSWSFAKVSSISGGVVKTTKLTVDPKDLEDIVEALDTFVKKDGSSIMTGPLKFIAGSYSGAIAGGLGDGIEIYKINSSGTIQTEVASITLTNGFIPGSTNTISVGSNALKWKNLYLAGTAYITKINNGYDIAVPVTNSADTLALKSQVDLAANSGRMITDQGLWYAKMYAATVAPSAENGTNYADFSQVDGQGNPIIVTYNRVNGAWVQDQTITPPAEYDGYVPVTSKIWDIAEQAGQQGGRILWNHQSKEFTPYPQIISFDSINITGNSTVVMPATPTDNSIPNKKYVDDAIAGSNSGYHPGLFAHEWDDHLRNDVQWLRADTFSWQNGSEYKEAFDYLFEQAAESMAWRTTTTPYAMIYTRKCRVAIGDAVYSDRSLTTQIGQVEAYSSGNITYNGDTYPAYGLQPKSVQTETIAGTTLTYYLADNGMKVVSGSTAISNVEAIYAATGVAWYYILDPENQRFKLPRTQYNEVGLRDTVGKYVTESLPNITATISGTVNSGSSSGAAQDGSSYAGNWNYGAGSLKYVDIDASGSSSAYQNNAPVQQRATQMYLYFYVGSFTQTAIENTAGLNAELFNGKADTDFNNTNMIDYVVDYQAPTAANNYTWYRKYKSGWVEQGGICTGTSDNYIVNLPVAMADSNYCISGISDNNSGVSGSFTMIDSGSQTTTGFIIIVNFSGAAPGTKKMRWQVRGMAA